MKKDYEEGEIDLVIGFDCEGISRSKPLSLIQVNFTTLIYKDGVLRTLLCFWFNQNKPVSFGVEESPWRLKHH